MPEEGTLRAWSGTRQMRNAQFRAYSGALFKDRCKQGGPRDDPDAIGSGKVHINDGVATAKSWICSEGRAGVAGTGCDSGEAGAAQQALPQWQGDMTRPMPAVCACARTGVQASNRLQTMANIVFTS